MKEGSRPDSRLVEEAWDSVAPGYADYWSPRLRPFLHRALESFAPAPAGPLAVPGCGPGDEVLELAQRYLAIEQIRFGRRLRVEWRLDPAAQNARLPPLLLQPLVENAVRHGVEPNDDGGELEVSTARRGDEVEIRIVNTVGAPARVAGHGLALRNVRQRLRLMHDVAARFDLESTDTRFSLRIVLPL